MAKQDELENLLIVEGINAQGFGSIAKIPMRDKRLAAEAKAIYAYIASFAGSGTSAFPSAEIMMEELKLSEKRFYKYRKQLTDYGYLEITVRRKGNRRTSNLYKLVTNPIVKTQHSQNGGVENFEHSQFESVQFESVQIDGTISNSIISNSITSIKNIVNKEEPLTNEQFNKIFNTYLKKGINKELFLRAQNEYFKNIKTTKIKKTHSAYFKGILNKILENKNGAGNTENLNSDLPTLQTKGMY